MSLVFGCGCGLPHRRVMARAAADGRGGAGRARVIDPHAHYFPQAFLDLLASPEGRAAGCDSVVSPEGFTVVAGGMRNGPLPRKFVDLTPRLAEMDASGV